MIPQQYHGDCLYNSKKELVEKLSQILRKPEERAADRQRLASYMERYSWDLVIDEYDRELEQVASVTRV